MCAYVCVVFFHHILLTRLQVFNKDSRNFIYDLGILEVHQHVHPWKRSNQNVKVFIICPYLLKFKFMIISPYLLKIQVREYMSMST